MVVTYQIDADDRLVEFGSEWQSIAGSSTALLDPARLRGRSIWQYIADDDTRHLHRVLLKKVRSGVLLPELPFRCDAPDQRRYMDMRIRLLPAGRVEYCCRLLRTESRQAMPVAGAPPVAAGPFLRMCSWCKQIEVAPGEWQEIEHAVARLQLFAEPLAPAVTHTICSACAGAGED